MIVQSTFGESIDPEKDIETFCDNIRRFKCVMNRTLLLPQHKRLAGGRKGADKAWLKTFSEILPSGDTISYLFFFRHLVTMDCSPPDHTRVETLSQLPPLCPKSTLRKWAAKIHWHSAATIHLRAEIV